MEKFILTEYNQRVITPLRLTPEQGFQVQPDWVRARPTASLWQETSKRCLSVTGNSYQLEKFKQRNIILSVSTEMNDEMSAMNFHINHEDGDADFVFSA